MLSWLCIGCLSSGGTIQQVTGRCHGVGLSPDFANPRVLLYSIASEMAAAKPEVSGPGTFMSAFVDAIHTLSAGYYQWIEKGNIKVWA
jgi:hydroxyethylthiazole kinase-like sugar kinase family protein